MNNDKETIDDTTADTDTKNTIENDFSCVNYFEEQFLTVFVEFAEEFKNVFILPFQNQHMQQKVICSIAVYFILFFYFFILFFFFYFFFFV